MDFKSFYDLIIHYLFNRISYLSNPDMLSHFSQWTIFQMSQVYSFDGTFAGGYSLFLECSFLLKLQGSLPHTISNQVAMLTVL